MILTVVTASLTNSQLVGAFYQSIEGLTISEITSMHVKLKGSVSLMSNLFNTTFSEYKCIDKNITCHASNSEVYIPVSLKSAIIGILGLETISTAKPNYVIKEEFKSLSPQKVAQKTVNSYFLPPQVATVYGFPNSGGSGVNIGIVSLGKYQLTNTIFLNRFFKYYI